MRKNSCICGLITVLFITVALTAVTGILWLLGYVPSVRLMMPYALAVGLVMTAFLSAVLLRSRTLRENHYSGCPDAHPSGLCTQALASAGLVGGAVFLACALMIFAFVLSPMIDNVLTFVTAASFWLLFSSFFASLLYPGRR